MNKASVAVIVGPTASGKSALGVAVAKALGGEIISADSMQIYRGMPIATAQPTAEETDGVPHHLIGFLSPQDRFSVAAYQRLCTKTITAVLQRGKLPILVGGTGLYIDAVIRNTRFLDVPDTPIRKQLEGRAEQEGTEPLLSKLQSIDPQTAAFLHLSDRKRIIRALEVYYSTGKTMTEQRLQSHDEESPFRFCVIGLTADDRDVLYDRIDRRVDQMLENGLLDEAQMFFAAEDAATAAQAIGYKELKQYLDGTAPLDACVALLKRETRRYAKRQLTWFRRYPEIHWLSIDRIPQEMLAAKAVAVLQKFLGETP